MLINPESISDIINIINSFFDKNKLSEFGLWFRGQANFSHSLIPTIFRQGNDFGGIKIDEVGMYREFNLLKTTQGLGKLQTFEWLTLMQHYGLPTRLLDWSANLLVALHFAVQNYSIDGALYVLDPVLFNGKSDEESGRFMLDQLNTQVIIRSCLSRIQSLNDLLNLKDVKDILTANKKKIEVIGDRLSSKWWQKTIQTPVAVYPAIQNDRLFLQHGRFTLHGGKIFDGKTIVSIESIEDIAEDSLLKIKISADFKICLEEELRLCGIYNATLFPELEHQSRYIKERWTKII